MVDVNAFTDDELRTKLVEYGFPVMPVTGTTRNLMAKKLKLLMESKSKPANERRSLGKFSSDEESDAEVKVTKKDKNRRVTMAVPPMQQAKVQPSTEERNEMEPPAQVPKEKKKARSAKIIVQVKDAQDTNSDSEPEIEIEVQKKKSASIKEPTPPPARPVKPLETVSSRVTTTSTSTSRYTTYTSPTTDSSERLEQMRSRLSLGAARKDYCNSESVLAASDLNGEGTPFLSNFTRRLSQMSPRTEIASGDFDYGSSVYARSNYTPSALRSRARDQPRDYSKASYVSSTEEEAKKPGNSNVSFILIAVVILFFIALAALYYGMHSGEQVGAIVGETSKYLPQDRI